MTEFVCICDSDSDHTNPFCVFYIAPLPCWRCGFKGGTIADHNCTEEAEKVKEEPITYEVWAARTGGI